jgi:hypothetical protein
MTIARDDGVPSIVSSPVPGGGSQLGDSRPSGLTPSLAAVCGSSCPLTGQIFSLLKSANARLGSETGDATDLPAVVSFVAQNLLHLLDIVPIPSRRHFFADIGSRSERPGVVSRSLSSPI